MDDNYKRIEKYLNNYYKRDKGRYIFKKRWVTLCNEHKHFKTGCNDCKLGTWNNILLLKIKNLFK